VPSDIQKLKAAGFRITNQRLGIIEALYHAKGKISIEDLHHSLAVEASLVTVYRGLEALEEAGIARRSFRIDGVVTFEYVSTKSREFEITRRRNGRCDKLPHDLNVEINAVIARVEQVLAIRGYEKVSAAVEFFAR